MATRLGPPGDAVELFHDGQSLTARRGEPLALTLLAADRLLLSRSPKLHRPRGPYCLRGACEGCLVRVNGLPNQPACRVLVEGGEQVETQNVLGTRETDLLSAADFLFPQGIDHHRLMAGIRGISPIVGNFARRIAGLGRLADSAPAVVPARHLEVPLLIVGGGRAGLTAAARLGALATLVDDGQALGGALIALEPKRAEVLVAAARQAGASLHPRATALALSREPDDGTGRITALIVSAEQTLVLRCQAVLLATGCHDPVPAFPNNDLPGIFSARAALLAWQNDVLIGNRIGVVGSGRYAERLVEQVQGAAELVQLDAESVVRAIGRERISGVEIRTDSGQRRIKLDALAFDGPGAPSFELAVQGGALVDFDGSAGYFPRADAQGRVAERLYVAGGDSNATLTAIEQALA
ncbi:MAG TPA: 2Fe-2S iron-sulfur cluster-binding protein [Polyangiaceae bacterium]|nr:2Fe-2S iron-sulfur cluster-binding protein [Polyangiaceae bacterium]